MRGHAELVISRPPGAYMLTRSVEHGTPARVAGSPDYFIRLNSYRNWKAMEYTLKTLVVYVGIGSLVLPGCGTNGDEATVDPAPIADVVERVHDAPDESSRDAAIEELALRAPDALPEIREIVRETQSPAVRGRLVKALGNVKDYDSVELLLGLLDDESVDVRREAHASLRELFGIDVHYEADGDEVARHAAIRRYRDFWKGKKNSKLIEWGKNPEKARQSLEKQVRFQ